MWDMSVQYVRYVLWDTSMWDMSVQYVRYVLWDTSTCMWDISIQYVRYVLWGTCTCTYIVRYVVSMYIRQYNVLWDVVVELMSINVAHCVGYASEVKHSCCIFVPVHVIPTLPITYPM